MMMTMMIGVFVSNDKPTFADEEFDAGEVFIEKVKGVCAVNVNGLVEVVVVRLIVDGPVVAVA